MKKRIQTIDKKVVIDGANENEILKNEILVTKVAPHKFTLKEVVDGAVVYASDGNYEPARTVQATGATINVVPASGYDALKKVVITPSDNLITVYDKANKFYIVTGGESGGSVTFQNIVGSTSILVCSEPSASATTVALQAVSSTNATVTCAASEVKYIALYSSDNISGTESGATKADSTKEVFTTKVGAFLI